MNFALAPDTRSRDTMGLLVIGLGRAGQARCRDIAAAPDLHLVEALGGRAGLDAHRRAIADPRVEAVLVCTENASHAALATLALEHDRHVLVEFPLADDAAAAESLLRLANARRRVLHLELIGLLTERHRGLRLRAGAIASIHADFAGGRYRWIDDELAAGHYGQLAIGRLHALWDLCGPLSLVRASRHESGGVACLEVELVGGRGQRLRLVERRGPELPRRAELVARDPTGAELVPDPVAALQLGLFATDLTMFAARIRGRAVVPAAVADDAILGVARLADAISAAASQASGQPSLT